GSRPARAGYLRFFFLRRNRPLRPFSASRSARISGPAALMMFSASSSSAATLPSSLPRLAGSSGDGGVTRVPWFHPTSARRRVYFGQSAGHRQGASGARSRSHFRTVSPLGYERLSKYLQSSRIG